LQLGRRLLLAARNSLTLLRALAAFAPCCCHTVAAGAATLQSSVSIGLRAQRWLSPSFSQQRLQSFQLGCRICWLCMR
jgi:hypothetical protein